MPAEIHHRSASASGRITHSFTMGDARGRPGAEYANRRCKSDWRPGRPDHEEPDTRVESLGAGTVAIRMVRRHRAFGIVMAAGLTLRVLAQAAYQPALLYIDSRKYLIGSNGQEPEGYHVMLRLLDPIGGLGLVVAVQHLFGLALAATVYVLLIRYQAPRWVAAVAAAPVLLDAYQLQLEQTIMPDVSFEAVIGAGLAVLIWPRRMQTCRRAQLVAGALILGVATTIREIGGVLLVPVMVLAFLAAAGWRRRVGHTALAVGCFLLPILIYMVGYLALTGHFDLPSNGPAPEYGRPRPQPTARPCPCLPTGGGYACRIPRSWRWAAWTACCTTRSLPA